MEVAGASGLASQKGRPEIIEKLIDSEKRWENKTVAKAVVGCQPPP